MAERSPLTHGAYRRTVFFAALDGLRGLSILAVLWHHADNVWFGWPALARGFLGVDVFFVLSGYLIVTLLLRERSRTGTIDLGRFYARRTLRIFPLFYAAIAAYFAATRVFGSTEAFASEPFAEALPYLLLYVVNWHIGAPHSMDHAWSLAAEEQFYLVWPPLERWLAGYLVPVLVGAIAINQAINFGLPSLVWPGFAHAQAELSILQVTFTPMLFGIGLAYLLHDERGYRRLEWLPRAEPLLVGLTLVVVALPISDIQGAPRLAFHALATGLLGCVVMAPDGRLGRFLQLRPLSRLGQVSYGVYVLHMLVVIFAAAVLARLGLGEVPGLLLVVSTAGSWGLAELSFRFFEAPFLRLKQRFSPDFPNRGPA